MADLPGDYRRDHLANMVARGGPALMTVVTSFFIIAQLVSLVSDRDAYGRAGILLLLGSVALLGFVPLLRYSALAGNANAAVASVIGFLALLTAGLCVAHAVSGTHALMRLPYAGLVTLAFAIFWNRPTHLLIGTLSGLALPTITAINASPTGAERLGRAQFALAIVVFAGALYLISHQVHGQIRKLTLDAQYRARHDWLTGLANRQYWLERAEQAGRDGAWREGSTSLLYIDIDHFKDTNDRLGHAAGDTLLKRTADTLRSVMPDTAIIGRFGGEEFVILLPGTSLDKAVAVSERVNEALAEDTASPMWLTVSIGIAEWAPGESMSDLLVRADRALLRAKAAGRRQSVVAGPTHQRAPRHDMLERVPLHPPRHRAPLWYVQRADANVPAP